MGTIARGTNLWFAQISGGKPSWDIPRQRFHVTVNTRQQRHRTPETITVEELMTGKRVMTGEKLTVIEKRENRKKFERNQHLKEATQHLPKFQELLMREGLWPLKRAKVEIMQINIGKVCNMTCHHCHVESGPTRLENMNQQTAERGVQVMKNSKSIHTVDITGGAPEMNPHFRYVVKEARKLGHKVIDRCNLTIMYEPGMTDLADFLAENQVEVVASLPCYSPKNVEKQRGKGVFEKSLGALQALNKLGYGKPDTGLQLHLVYNPVGPSLPPSQQKLELQYKEELKKHCDIEFNRLFTITNMPIKRFADDLYKFGEYQKYMELLVNNFNSGTVNDLMCRNTVNIGWDGRLYDCDFNQALEIDLGRKPISLFEISSLDELENEKIGTDMHCFGCTAGTGSSCGGALV